jgi:chaperonin GroES
MFSLNNLRHEMLWWHVIRFEAKLTGAFSANLAADSPVCRKGRPVVSGSQFVNSQEVRSTGQEKVMAKKASAAGTRIVPLGDRVVLKRAEAEEKTAGGILLPDSAQGKPQRGEVIAVGDGHTNDKGGKIPLSVKEGDRVIFSSYAGDEISVGDVTYLLMRESDILAKV